MHSWKLFYSPRNGRISIQACAKCGVAKGMVHQGHKCSASGEKKSDRLKGWTLAAPITRYSELLMSGARLSA